MSPTDNTVKHYSGTTRSLSHTRTGGGNPRPQEEEGKLCSPPSAPDQCEELVAGFRIFSEDAQHGAGDSFTVHLLDAAHHHAHVTAGRGGRDPSQLTGIVNQMVQPRESR